MARKYPIKDVKLLFGLAAGRCNNPGCRTECILDETELEQTKVLGKIAHVFAHGEKGPRANPDLSDAQKDSYDNWILLCPSCHDKVDLQPDSHSAELLFDWKEQHESWVKERLAEVIPEITFVEMEVITKALLAQGETSFDLQLTPPLEKMKKNNLTNQIQFQITMGLAKAGEVAQFINHVAVLDHTFPDQLKSGFVNEYNRLLEQGYKGDSLYEALLLFASQGVSDFKTIATGMAVLSYLFQKCDVFEA